jgi:PadR family transcriptional regulator PadR
VEYGPELLKGNIQTLVLAVLESGPLHGYGLVKEIQVRSEDALAFGEGTIYPALKALQRDGFIEGSWDMSASGPPRKIYNLTQTGTYELARRRDLWNRFSRTIDRVIGGETNVQPA